MQRRIKEGRKEGASTDPLEKVADATRDIANGHATASDLEDHARRKQSDPYYAVIFVVYLPPPNAKTKLTSLSVAAKRVMTVRPSPSFAGK